MPPHGLYRIPPAHLFASSPSPTLPRFNTMDFADDDNTPEKAAIEEAAQIVGVMTSEAGKKRSKGEKKRRRSEGEVKERGRSADETPVALSKEEKKAKKKKEKGAKYAHKSEKKRKRESDIQARPSAAAHDQDVLASKNDAGANLKPSYSVDQLTEFPSKKKFKSKRKSTDASTEETQERLDSRVVKQVEATSTEESAKNKKSKKDRKLTNLETPDASNHLEANTQSDAQNDKSPYFTTPKNTPIPLPPKPALRKKQTAPATTVAGSPQERPAQAGRDVMEVLVVETPPRTSRETTTPWKTPWKTPVPFKLPTSDRSKGGNDVREHINQGPSLTSSNLRDHTEPINDKPKPRPRGARGESVASFSSMSIKDAFARQCKPSPIESDDSNLDSTPFFTPTSTRKYHTNPFTSAFQATHSLIDFSAEKHYLITHLTWRASTAASGPPPCLSKATGCDASKERALLALKEDTSNLLSLAIASDAGTRAFNRAVAASRTAETFLRNAILVQVPVPVGAVEGIYTLYCPTYAETHMDKYGFGQRTLSITKPKGFKQNYMARLFCPPRSMVYSTMSFTVPSHASFRPTTLTTSAEGYTMELVVLGNGYIILKVDLGLFLKGKKAEDGAGEMEFLGVREKDAKTGEGAVEWDGVEEEVGEMVARDGEREREKKRVEVEQTPKKKVGRPTNVERARRAAEKEKEKEAAERGKA